MTDSEDSLDRKQARKIFSALGKEGAIRILKEARNRLESSRDTPQEIGLSRRQYYTRLRDLKKLELIEKKGKDYVITDKGKKIDRLWKSILSSKNEKPKEDRFSTEISDMNYSMDSTNLKAITSYEESVREGKKIIENTEKELLVASKYVDHRILKELVQKNEEVEVKGITRELTVSDGFDVAMTIIPPGKLKKLIKFTQENGKVLPDLPFSFIIRDREIVLVEIPNPIKPDDFFLEIVLENEKICDRMVNLFYDLYDVSEQPSIPQEKVSSSILNIRD